jgi:hypothetical protein
MSSCRTTISLLLVGGVLAACAAGDALKALQGESITQYPAVEAWTCAPDRAQLVLDARGATGFGPFSLEGAVIARTDMPATPVYARAVNAKRFGSWDSVGLFADLPPGTYRVVQLRLVRPNAVMTVPVPMPTTVPDKFTVTLAPGQLAYLGQVVFEEKPGLPARRSMDLVADPARQRVASTILKDRFPTSPCINLLDKQAAG